MNLYSQYDVNLEKSTDRLSSYREGELKRREELGNCKFVPYHEFKEGMKFYFPKSDYKEKDTYKLTGYSFLTNGKKGKIERNDVFYKDLAGKIFVIESIEDRKESVFENTYIILKEVDGLLRIEHKMIYSRSFLKEKWLKNPFENYATMDFAIYTNDIDLFKEKYLNKEIYLKKLIKGGKYQKVKIVDVGAGEIDSPIRVIVENNKGEKSQVDICTCGTNTQTKYSRDFYFYNIFQFENPRDCCSISDENWALICMQKIKIGFTEQELKLSYGIPKTVNETTELGKVRKELIFENRLFGDQYVYLENGIVTSFQSKN